MAEVDEALTVKVIEFNRDDKRILVSHLRYLEDIQREASDKVKGDQRSARPKSRKPARSQQSAMEKTTLGDLDALAQLKDQLGDEKEGKEESKTESDKE